MPQQESHDLFENFDRVFPLKRKEPRADLPQHDPKAIHIALGVVEFRAEFRARPCRCVSQSGGGLRSADATLDFAQAEVTKLGFKGLGDEDVETLDVAV